MSINATVDSRTYEGIQTVMVGGKTISLTEVSEASSAGVAKGSVTLEETVDHIDITGLSFFPKAFAICRASAEDMAESPTECCGVVSIMNCALGYQMSGAGAAYSGVTKVSVQGGSNYWNFNETGMSDALDITVGLRVQRIATGFRVMALSSNKTTQVFKAGQTYNWIAIGWED